MSTDLFVFPMSFAQQRLWFLEQMNPHSASYNVSGAVRLIGPLDIETLQQTLDALVERHESLRTTFAVVDGGPAQIVARRRTITLPVIPIDAGDGWLDAVHELALAAVRRPFDLTRGPLLRAALLRRNETDHILLTSMHHMISDGWSTRILLRELSILYSARLSGKPAPLPELAIQYADFAHWQREWLQGEVLERQTAYWKQRLANPSTLHLPTDEPRPAMQTTNGSIETFRLPAALAESLKAVSRREGVTLFTLLLAVFQVLLHRYSGQDDILVGTPVANRNQTAIEGIIGLFVNTLVLRADLSGNPAFRDLLQQVHRTALDAYTHQDLPFEKLIDELQLERNLSYPPLFQVAFTFQDAPLQALTMPGVSVEPLNIHTGTAKFDLTLDIEATETDLNCLIEYNTDLFAPTTIARIAAHLQCLLAAIARDPGRRIGSLPLLTAEEQQQLIGAGDVHAGRSAPESCLHVLFEAQVRHRPDAIAVVYGGEQITYADLDRRAGRVARHLRRLGVGPDTLVALYLDRSPELVLGILGVLKAGGAYVPLDPAYPRERLAMMLEDSRAPIVVTRQSLAGELPDSPARLVCLDQAYEDDACRDEPPHARTLPANRAYIIYTSGSTGRPKGVEVTHANVLRLFQETEGWFHFDQADAWTLFHSYAFDFSVWEIWGALLYGGRLVVVPYRVSRSPDLFYALLAAEQVTVLNQTPSAFRQLVQAETQGLAQARPLALRYVIFGGEAFDPGWLPPWFERHGSRPQLVNMYGITETTVHVTYRPITAADAADSRRSPIGGPIPHLRIYLLDRYLNLVPPGVVGEIYVGGGGLARGYLNRPDLTAERFVPTPFAERGGEGERGREGESEDGGWDSAVGCRWPALPLNRLGNREVEGSVVGSRLYKTGDLARSLPGGDLEYLGRADAQVKIRGFRIEPGEIDAALRRHPGVRASLTVVREDVPGEKRLVAYIIPKIEDRGLKIEDSHLAAHQELSSILYPLSSDLRAFLKDRLPDYMIPTAFIVLDTFPLTENGKIDRRALPAPQQAHVAAELAYVVPRSPTEELLAVLWAGTLNVDRVGIYDNFFAIGGDSILSLQILAMAKQRGISFSIPQLFQHPTIAELAQVVTSDATTLDEIQTAPFSLITSEDYRRLPPGLEDAYPLAMLQTGMLYHMALAPGSNMYHNTDSFFVRAGMRFDLARFQEAVAAVVERHAILRTGFDLTSYREPLQLVYRRATLPVVMEDIRHLSFEEQERVIHELIDQERARHFDIASPTLLRFFIHLRADDLWQFTLTECHAIIDGWSLQSTLVEVFQRYLALLKDEKPPEAPPLSVSFRDFVAMERQALASPACAQFWTRQLDRAAFLRLPRWHNTPTLHTPGQIQIEQLTIEIAPALQVGLQQIVRANALPLKSILLAAHLKVLSFIGGQADVLTGVAMNGRPETPGGTQLRGLFINTVPFRLKVAPGSWLELIQATFAAEREILPFRRYPVAAIQQQWGRQPLYEVMFNYLNFHILHGLAEAMPDLESLGSIRAEATNATLLAHFLVDPLTGRMTLDLDYDSTQLCHEQIEQIGAYYTNILAAMVEDLHGAHHTYSPLTAAERHRLLLEWNRPEASGYDSAARCIHHRVEEQAARTPDRVAVVAEELHVTYAELNSRANRLAHHLRRLGIGPNVLVGICLEPSLDMTVAVLGVLKAGGAYIPLDPAYPRERLAWMFQEARMPVLITRSALQERLPASGAHILCLDAAQETLGQMPDANPASNVSPNDLIYVIFTSGSTGRPKGAGVFHHSFTNLLNWFTSAFTISELDRVLLMTSMSFDLTQKNVYAPLITGGTLHLWVASYYDPDAITRLISERQVTLLNCTPSAFYPLVDGGTPAVYGRLESLRHVFLGGEPIAAERLGPWARSTASRAQVVNTYGPTECADICGFYRLHDATYARNTAVPIGGSIDNVQMFVLGPYAELLPVGVVGELCVAGVGVGYGYIGDAALTAAKFVPDPFSHRPGARMYRTGDLAKQHPDGAVEFAGRLDHQVKVRGFRIELGEIEHAVAAHPSVRECVALLRNPDEGRGEDTPGEGRLVAYVVPSQEQSTKHREQSSENQEPRTKNQEPRSEQPDSPFSILHPPSSILGELRAFLQDRLPDYMVPAAFVLLEALPLTPNGKVDRKALPVPARASFEVAATYMPPQNELERAIADIWKEVLQLDQVGIHDSFFDLGGHSLLIIRMHGLLRQHLDRDLLLTDVLQYPTIHALAEYLARGTEHLAERTQRRIETRREARREAVDRGRSRDRRAVARTAGDGE